MYLDKLSAKVSSFPFPFIHCIMYFYFIFVFIILLYYISILNRKVKNPFNDHQLLILIFADFSVDVLKYL